MSEAHAGHSVSKLISGGQTGVDRAVLDVALQLGIPIGGWVPRGRLAEDGVIPERYRELQECATAEYAERTECNVRDADATLVLSHGKLAGGSALTVRLARRLGKALLHLDLNALDFVTACHRLQDWLHAEAPAVLNVAGPRASEDASIYAASKSILTAVLSDQPQ